MPPAEEAGKRAAVGSALHPEDYVHAQLNAFMRRVEHSLSVIRKSVETGPIGVSFSGGKDSVVTLDLVRRVLPDAPAALFDSGTELAGTHEMAAHVGAIVIHPRLTMLDLARYAGWWGFADPVDPDVEFDAKQVLIQEPSETFVVRHRLRVVALGLRAQESRGRAAHTLSRGELYRGRDGTWYCNPIARWSLADIWAYIASRGLRYHPAYDALSAAGLPRESQRVSGALGERGAGWGRHAMLRIVDPEQWHVLVREFPSIGLQG